MFAKCKHSRHVMEQFPPQRAINGSAVWSVFVWAGALSRFRPAAEATEGLLLQHDPVYVSLHQHCPVLPARSCRTALEPLYKYIM